MPKNHLMARSGTFISYARADGEAFANTLRLRLQTVAPDLRVWQDRPELEGGVGWWRQIEAALERVEFLIVVLTPGALASQITRKEWRAARQAGVCVFPVKGPGYSFEDSRIPGWMQRTHVYDIEAQWDTLLAHLRRGCQVSRVPFMAPPLPAGLVGRSREFKLLHGLVLDERTGDTVAITTSLAGAGGFGKTTLAATLCHDDDVVAAFDDGVLWATLGQTPNLQGELTRLYAALTGERPNFISIEDAAQALSEKLENKRCLIVIDDVWDVVHLRPFLRGGPMCARLVTTRQMQVAAEGRCVDVDQMTPQEATMVLVARLPETPVDTEPFRRLSRRLGEWPLLLRLAGSALRQRIDRGDTVEGALRYVERALDRRGVTAFDRDQALDRNEAVASTLAMSLDLLDPADRERCSQLAIFPEDAAIPAVVAGELWGLDDLDTEEALTRLHDASLIDLDLATGIVRVHDVMRSCFGQRLGHDTSATHQRLLEAWGNRYMLPHSYAWRRLSHHLIGAGQAGALAALLLDYAWLRSKLDATDIYALLDDFRFAPAEPRLQLLHNVLRLSSHVLGRDRSQLGPQLLGRVERTDPLLASMVADADADVQTSATALSPRFASLVGAGGALMRTLECPGAPNALAATPDGRWLVASTGGGTIAVWDLASGTLVRTLGAAETQALTARQWGSSFALLPDGRLLLPGSRALSVWDPAGDADPVPLVHGRDLFGRLIVSRDGRWAVLGTSKGALIRFDLHGADAPKELVPARPDAPGIAPEEGRLAHRLGITSVAIDSTDQRVLTGSYDKTVRVWDLASGDLLETLYPPHEGIVYAVATARTAAVAASASADRSIRLWDLDTMTCRQTFEAHSHRVYDVVLASDGKRMLSASHDRTVRLWHVDDPLPRATLGSHSEAVGVVAFLPGERTAVSAAKDGTIRIWQLEATDRRAPTQEHDGPIQAVAVAGDGRMVLSGGQDHKIRVWDASTGQVRQVLSGHHDAVSSIALAADRRTAMSGGYDRRIIMWDLETGAVRQVLQGHADAVSAVALDGAGDWSMSASWDGDLTVWAAGRIWPRRRWTAHRRGITFLALQADQRTALTGSMDGDLKVWDTTAARCLRTVTAHLGGITTGAMSPGREFVLTGGTDGTLRLWRWPTLELLHSVAAHSDKIASVGFAAEAAVAFSSGADRYVRLWKIPGLLPAQKFACDAAIDAAGLSADAHLVVAGDAQGCLHFLDVSYPAQRP